jgi:hypothetical protein
MKYTPPKTQTKTSDTVSDSKYKAMAPLSKASGSKISSSTEEWSCGTDHTIKGSSNLTAKESMRCRAKESSSTVKELITRESSGLEKDMVMELRHFKTRLFTQVISKMIWSTDKVDTKWQMDQSMKVNLRIITSMVKAKQIFLMEIITEEITPTTKWKDSVTSATPMACCTLANSKTIRSRDLAHSLSQMAKSGGETSRRVNRMV